MPVRVREVDPVGHHHAVADFHAMGRTDPHTGADQTVVADVNSPMPLAHGPDAQAYPGIVAGDHRGKSPQLDRCPEQLHEPGTHEMSPAAQAFELGAQETPHIELLQP